MSRSTCIAHIIAQFLASNAVQTEPDHQQNRGRQLESRHNSRTELYNQNSYNSFPSKYRLLLVLLVSALSFQRATINPADRQTDRPCRWTDRRQCHTCTYIHTDYRMPPWLRPLRHNYQRLCLLTKCKGNLPPRGISQLSGVCYISTATINSTYGADASALVQITESASTDIHNMHAMLQSPTPADTMQYLQFSSLAPRPLPFFRKGRGRELARN